jgi:hypothetical protein
VCYGRTTAYPTAIGVQYWQATVIDVVDERE